MVSDSGAAVGAANPIGAITYSRPPRSADFVSASGAQTATVDLHYAEGVPAGGSVTYDWSYSQADDSAGLGPLEQVERDRFGGPAISVAVPRQNEPPNALSAITAAGWAQSGVSAHGPSALAA